MSKRTIFIIATLVTAFIVFFAFYTNRNPYLGKQISMTKGALNPIITQENMNSNICNPNWSTDTVRPPVSYTRPIKERLCKEYNCGNVKDYELDHVISLVLGGDPKNTDNLWLQKYNIPNGARQKDRLENVLHTMVCNMNISLKDAQNIISGDWYKKYLEFNLDKKLGADGVDKDDI